MREIALIRCPPSGYVSVQMIGTLVLPLISVHWRDLFKDIWDPVFYNRSQDVTNPLRDILKFQINNNPDTQSYFRHMSEAFAALCTDNALVLTNDSYNVNEKGIWGQVEKPTLQKTGNIGGQCDQVSSSPWLNAKTIPGISANSCQDRCMWGT